MDYKPSPDRILFIVLWMISIYVYTIWETILGISFTVLIIFAFEVFFKRNVGYLLEPAHHKNGVLHLLFDMNMLSGIVLVSSLFIVIFALRDVSLNVLFALTGYYLLRSIKFDESAFRRTSEMFKGDGLDYGSGLAYNFFHGYLAIIIPDKGDNNKGIKEMMTNYEDCQSIKFAKKKLFILVPSSLYCPPDLMEVSGQRGGPSLEAAKTLGEVFRKRAGVIDRSYKNSVYKIHKDKHSQPVYVVAEGATPLLTLYNSLTSNSDHCGFYKVHKADIVRMFNETLVHLLTSNVEYRDLCEVVYYDNDKEDVNVAQILLDKLEDKDTKSSLNR